MGLFGKKDEEDYVGRIQQFLTPQARTQAPQAPPEQPVTEAPSSEPPEAAVACEPPPEPKPAEAPASAPVLEASKPAEPPPPEPTLAEVAATADASLKQAVSAAETEAAKAAAQDGAPPRTEAEPQLPAQMAVEVDGAADTAPTIVTKSEAPSPVPEAKTAFVPPVPEDVGATRLGRPFIQELVLRTLYFGGDLTGASLSERCALPFQQVLLSIMNELRDDNSVEVKGQRGIGDAGYIYGLTDRGTTKAHEALAKLGYLGPAPVQIDDYIAAVKAQTIKDVVVTKQTVRKAFDDLIIVDSILEEVGPAVNSASSIFLFGYPGNGKTAIAERVTHLLGSPIFIPQAVEVDGQVLKLFDPINHVPIGSNGIQHDERWIRIQRPTVMVGGELTMASLDLIYNENTKYYEAPLQMKANLGMFLIDDFGRQLMRPTELLNRWIVPLEKKVDFLTLATGKKIQIPFDQLIVFSTNLDPKDLVDDAFLRRIKFKINIVDPDLGQFHAIFRLMCGIRKVEYDEAMVNWMIEKHWTPVERPLRMCQPRDILDQIIAIAKYNEEPARLSEALIERACETYFVSLSTGASGAAR